MQKKEKSNYVRQLFERSDKIKKECLLSPDSNVDQFISIILDELLLIASISEEEVDKLIEYANFLNVLCDTSENSLNDPLNKITNGIYEAVAFQDLNCQRINKIIMLLENIVGEFNNSKIDFQHTVKKEQKLVQNKLLNGPQDPKHAQTQEFIDSFF